MLIFNAGGLQIHLSVRLIVTLANVRRDLQSRRSEYQDFQSEKRIKNAYIQCRWIANPPERKINSYLS